jgi:CPA1 family monovalent cation:H+ antiporter
MHDSSLITLIILVISGLVGLNALSYYSERLMLFPSVIWVLCLGMIYGALTHFGLFHLPELHLDPKMILFVSSILATFGIVISMICVAVVLYWVFHVPFLESLLFGVIVSATDPIAVSAILHEAKDISTEKKCSLKENQSLMMVLLLRSLQPFL